jgi:phosphonoacetate hydrolase
MLPESRSQFILHEKIYRLPLRPTVAICVDGFDPEYLSQGIQDGILPNMAKMVSTGFHAIAQCAMPSFTNPNNVSIISGAPTARHGIAGNFYLDPATLEEKMVLDDTLLRDSTILEQLARRGVTVAAITAKDKLRAIINHGLDPSLGHISFSAQHADKCTLAANGIENVENWLGQPTPSQYSGDLSLFVLDAGVKLLEEKRADVYYLTLSDFVQHKYAPGDKEANEFMAGVDRRIGRLVELGAIVAVTGDHGMSDKCNEDGTPNVLFLETEVARQFGEGFARVICPITDPFVRHHGALGSFVRVHIDPKATRSVSKQEVVDFIQSLPQVLLALDGAAAADRFEMPKDREADIVVISHKNAVIGSRKEEHDFANLKGHRLRSHGGLSEQEIPLLRSLPADVSPSTRQWHNYDIFDLLLNY